MATLLPDPTFYPSPKMAMQAPEDQLAYVVLLNPDGNGRPDALAVTDVDPGSTTYQQVVGRIELGMGDEVHHFGWNACSAALCPYAPHPHVERRYLLVPGLKSSHIYVIHTKPDPQRRSSVGRCFSRGGRDHAGCMKRFAGVEKTPPPTPMNQAFRLQVSVISNLLTPCSTDAPTSTRDPREDITGRWLGLTEPSSSCIARI
jgi:56kDa selenium binding protein (SBP56)